MLAGGFRRLVAALSTRMVWASGTQVVVARAIFLLGLVVQLALTVLLWLMVDLVLDVMQLWVELAAKHLRIVLDESA